MIPLAEQQTPVWTPFSAWTTTPEARRELALYLADLARIAGMGGTIAAGLAALAGGLSPEERWTRLWGLVAVVRDDADDHDARVDDAVADLCEVPS